jgi:hypothetical protein
MTVTIELSPDETSRLEAEARRRGLETDEAAKRLIVERLPSEQPGAATLALLKQWEEEDETDDPEEIARRIKDWEEFRDEINETRRSNGERILYP